MSRMAEGTLAGAFIPSATHWRTRARASVSGRPFEPSPRGLTASSTIFLMCGSGCREQPALAKSPPQPADKPARARGRRQVYDPADQDMKDVSVYHRDDLVIGSLVPGPAVIAEDETTTIVPKSFAARVSPIGAIVLEKVGT